MSSNHDKNAVARYAAVSFALAKVASGMTLRMAIAETIKLSFFGPDGRPMRLTGRTLFRWVAAYRKGGLDALRDRPRDLTIPSRALSEDFLAFLVQEKEADPDASIPDVIRRAEILGKTVPGGVARATVWRAARRMGLPIFSDKCPRANNKRRFAYAHRMQMVLCDGKHFRAGEKRRKRVVFFFLDDCTRKVLAAVVGSSETTELFLRGLMRVLRRFGRMNALYLDRGSAFRADDPATICGRIFIALIHGKERYPEGHGKIEKFNQTALHDLLRTFDGDPTVDPSTEALELRCEHYLTEQYNKRSHESLDQVSPDAKWASDLLELDFPPDFTKVENHFIVTERRKVSRDNVIQVDGVFYEMPLGYAGRRVDIHRDLLHQTVSVLHEGKMMQIKPVDLVFNAICGRVRPKTAAGESLRRPVKTAARLAFDRDYASIVGPAGDFSDDSEEEE